MKLLEENISSKLLDIYLGNNFGGFDTKNKGNKCKNKQGITSYLAWRAIPTPLSNSTGGLTPWRPLSGLQEIPIVTQEDIRILCFPSSRGLTLLFQLCRNPAIEVRNGEEPWGSHLNSR